MSGSWTSDGVGGEGGELDHIAARTGVVRKSLAALALLGVILWSPTAAAAQEVVYSGSLGYATGEYYFTQPTNSAYLQNGLSVETGRLRLSADLPVLWQSTPWVSQVSGRGVPTGGTQQGEVEDGLGQRGRDGDGRGPGATSSFVPRAATTPGSTPRSATVRDGRLVLEDTTRYDEAGVGDPTLRVEAELTSPASAAWSVALGAQVKPALADPDRGFGTGAWDGGVDVSVARRLGSSLLFADVGYLVLGDMRAIELQDPVTYSAGLGHTLPGGNVGLLASVAGSSRILAGTDPPLEVGAGMNVQLSPGRSLGAGVAVGLTESSPDLSASAGWTVKL